MDPSRYMMLIIERQSTLREPPIYSWEHIPGSPQNFHMKSHSQVIGFYMGNPDFRKGHMVSVSLGLVNVENHNFRVMLLLMVQISGSPLGIVTVDGSEIRQTTWDVYLIYLWPCKEWDKLPTSTGGWRNSLHQHSRWLKLSSHFFCRVMDACGILVWETHTLEILELNIIHIVVLRLRYTMIHKLLWCIMIIRSDFDILLLFFAMSFDSSKNCTQRFLMIAPPIKEPAGSRDRPKHWQFIATKPPVGHPKR